MLTMLRKRLTPLALVTVLAAGSTPAVAGEHDHGARDVVAKSTAGVTGLDLGAALSLATTHSPRLAGLAHELAEADARALQAGLMPNPVLRTEVENVAGTGAFSGTDEAETTILLSQRLELGGKRSGRREVAELEIERMRWSHARNKAVVMRDAALAFVAVLAEQELLALAHQEIELAREVRATVSRRVEAGSGSRVELERANVALSMAELQRERRERALTAARQTLAGTWGETMPGFERVLGALGATRTLPALEVLRAGLVENPALAGGAVEVARREALVELAQSEAVPDIELGAGYRRISGPDEQALVAALSVVLPVFDRNQGGIREAREHVLHAHDERRFIELDLQMRLAEAHVALSTALTEIRAFDESLLPGAERTFAGLRAGYREGRFSYLEVLDAQRAVVSIRSGRIRSLADYHRSLARIEHLTGRPLTAGLGVGDSRTEESE